MIYHLNLIFWINSFLFITSVDIADCSCLQAEIFLYFFITISVLCVQMPMIKLQSLEGEVFEIDVEIARQSVTIKTMLEGNQKLFYSVYRPIVFIEKWKYIKSFCTHKKWITSSSCQKGLDELFLLSQRNVWDKRLGQISVGEIILWINYQIMYEYKIHSFNFRSLKFVTM